MSIVGRISQIETVDEGLKIHLVPEGKDSVGQESLVIVDPTWTPELGQLAWGGGNSVVIEPLEKGGPRHSYWRFGYTRLGEHFNLVDSIRMDKWWQYDRAKGLPNPGVNHG